MQRPKEEGPSVSTEPSLPVSEGRAARRPGGSGPAIILQTLLSSFSVVNPNQTPAAARFKRGIRKLDERDWRSTDWTLSALFPHNVHPLSLSSHGIATLTL